MVDKMMFFYELDSVLLFGTVTISPEYKTSPHITKGAIYNYDIVFVFIRLHL